jgi:DNA-binding NarL/FixJ family response regulator
MKNVRASAPNPGQAVWDGAVTGPAQAPVCSREPDVEIEAPIARCFAVTITNALARVSIEAPDEDSAARLREVLARHQAPGVGPTGADIVVCWPSRDESAAMVATIRALRARRENTRVVAVIPSERRNGELRKALRAGADGIVCEADLDASLGATLDAVAAGQIAVPRELRAPLTRRALSFREKQVLGMVVMGLTNRQIAAKLYLAESTVKTHLSSAFEKLGAHSRAEAASMILDPDEGLGPGILSVEPRESVLR